MNEIVKYLKSIKIGFEHPPKIWHLCEDCAKGIGECESHPIFMSYLCEVPPPNNDAVIICDGFEKKGKVMTIDAMHRMALKKWGLHPQLVVAIEEFAEATKEIAKIMRNNFSKRPTKSFIPLASELADAKIMMDQLIAFYGLEDCFAIEYTKKLNRTMERLLHYE